MIQLFTYIVVLVILGNPVAVNSATSDAYSEIFSAPDDDAFVQAVDQYFEEQLSKSWGSVTNIVQPDPNSQILDTQDLGNSFYIESTYTTQELINSIQFLLYLGSTTSSTFTVQILQDGVMVQPYTITVASSTQWNTINLVNNLTGTFSIKIIGTSTHSGDRIPTFSPTSMIAINSSVSSTSTYYFDTVTYTTEPVWRYVCDPPPFGGCWNELVGYEQVAHHNWQTTTLNEISAIKVNHIDTIGWKYQLGAKSSGYYPITKIHTKNGLDQSEDLKGFVTYPSYTGYSVDTTGTNPDLTTGIPFDQQILILATTENSVSQSLDPNVFFDNVATLLADEQGASSSLWSTVYSESETFFERYDVPWAYVGEGSHYFGQEGYRLLKYGNIPASLLLVKELRYSGWVCDVYQPPPIDKCSEGHSISTSDLLETYGHLALASTYGIATSPDTIILLKTASMYSYPTEPDFMSWIFDLSLQQGDVYNQTLQDQIRNSVQLSSLTNTNLSLVLDQEAPTGVNPYVADVMVKDAKGNMAMGTLPVVIKATNGTTLTTGTVVNGTARLTLPDYSDTAIAVVDGNNFYFGSQKQNNVQYDLGNMIKTQGPPGSDPVVNAKWYIVSKYIENSGAFNYDPTSGNYTMNANDWCDKWTDSIPIYGSVDRGYCVVSTSPISTQELKSGQFDSGTFTVTRYSGAGVPPSQYTHDYELSKMNFFDLWIGQKLQPCSYGGNPPEPSGYTGLDSLANDGSTFINEHQSYFQTDSGAKDFSAKVKGLAIKATSLGFPDPQGALEQLADWVNGIINDVIGYIQSVWSDLTTFAGTFVVGLWNYILGSALGQVIELVKSIVEVVISTVVNSIIDCIQSNNQNSEPIFTQDQFSYVQQNKGVISNFFTIGFGNLSFGSEFQYLNEFGQKQAIFDGAGTIFSLVIDIAGPGIVSVIIEEVATYLFNNIVMSIIASMSGTSLLDIVNSLFGTSDTPTSGSGISLIVENFASLFDYANAGSDIIGSAINGVSNYAGSLFDGFLNWFIDTGKNLFNGPEVINFPIYSDIFGLINTIVYVVDNIFNIAPEHFNEMKNVGLAIADEIMSILEIKASDPATKTLIEFMKLSFDFESMGLALYDACEKLLNDGMTFPQKVLFSLLWMIKIVNSFTGSVLSFFHDFFGIFTGITNLALSIFPQLESYTIILNVVIEGAIFLFFHSFLINNNFLDIISNPQQLILLGFTSMFIAKSLVLSYPIKIMQSNGASEELIKLKETDNIKYSIMLELSQVALKIIGILDF